MLFKVPNLFTQYSLSTIRYLDSSEIHAIFEENSELTFLDHYTPNSAKVKSVIVLKKDHYDNKDHPSYYSDLTPDEFVKFMQENAVTFAKS